MHTRSGGWRSRDPVRATRRVGCAGTSTGPEDFGYCWGRWRGGQRAGWFDKCLRWFQCVWWRWGWRMILDGWTACGCLGLFEDIALGWQNGRTNSLAPGSLFLRLETRMRRQTYDDAHLDARTRTIPAALVLAWVLSPPDLVTDCSHMPLSDPQRLYSTISHTATSIGGLYDSGPGRRAGSHGWGGCTDGDFPFG